MLPCSRTVTLMNDVALQTDQLLQADATLHMDCDTHDADTLRNQLLFLETKIEHIAVALLLLDAPVTPGTLPGLRFDGCS